MKEEATSTEADTEPETDVVKEEAHSEEETSRVKEEVFTEEEAESEEEGAHCTKDEPSDETPVQKWVVGEVLLEPTGDPREMAWKINILQRHINFLEQDISDHISFIVAEREGELASFSLNDSRDAATGPKDIPGNFATFSFGDM